MRRDVLDPGPDLREMRESAGIHRMDSLLGVPAYVITRHDDVKAALADHERFSNHRPPELVRPPGAVVTEEERDIGIGMVGDGEFGKATSQKVDYGAWWSYSFQRLGGLELGKASLTDIDTAKPGAGGITLTSFGNRRDRQRFAAAYHDPTSGIATGPG